MSMLPGTRAPRALPLSRDRQVRPAVLFALAAAVLAALAPGPTAAAAADRSAARPAQAAPAAAPADTPAPSPAAVLPPGFDALVARVMKAFDVPGLGLAVVKDGRVVLAKGYGVREMGRPAPVDARTLFGIASNTKAFTATALGLLVEEGKIEWDGQVTRYLPWFQMFDPYVTREMTVRDLLVHRSGLGLGAGDLLLWPESSYTRREIVGRLRFIRPATSFRSAYAYDNMLYVAAGELIEAVSGLTWEDFIVERIFKKAGLASSRPRHSAALAASPDGNVALPHALADGRPTPSAVDENDNMNAAGGILSCADDMARWMNLHLAAGRLPDGTRLFGDRTERQLTAIVTPIPIGEPAPELAAQRMNFSGYALGFRVNDYRGRRLVSHTGGLSGYVSKIVMVPELGLGVAVLTNQQSDEAYNSVIYAVLDRAMGAPATDWAAAYLQVRDRARARTADTLRAAEAKRDRSVPPSLPLAAYAGAYEDAWYGPVDVTVEGDGPAARLVMSFAKTPGFAGGLEHWSRETFVVRWRDRGLGADAYVSFVLDPDGAIDEVRMKPFSPETDFSYDFQDLLLKPVKR